MVGFGTKTDELLTRTPGPGIVAAEEFGVVTPFEILLPKRSVLEPSGWVMVLSGFTMGSEDRSTPTKTGFLAASTLVFVAVLNSPTGTLNASVTAYVPVPFGTIKKIWLPVLRSQHC